MISRREGMAEMAAMAIGAGIAEEDHAAEFRFISGVAENGTELGDAMGELAVSAIWAQPTLLPLVAELGLEHTLVVDLQLQ